MRQFIRAGALALAIAGAVSLGGCQNGQTFGQWFGSASAKLDVFNQKVSHYAPIVGKDLIAFANIVYQVECSPARQPVSGVSQKVLKIVAPNSTAADNLITRLQQNDDIADQICPLVQSIQASIAAVPQNAPPSQVIAPAPAS